MGSVGCYGSQNEPEGKFSTEPLSWGTDYIGRPYVERGFSIGKVYCIKENNGSTFIIDPGAYKTGPGPPGAPPGCPGAAPGPLRGPSEALRGPSEAP